MDELKGNILKSIIEDINEIELTDVEVNTQIEDLNILNDDILEYSKKINLLRVRQKEQLILPKSQILILAFEKLKLFKENNIENAKEKLLSLLGSDNKQLQWYFSKVSNIDELEALDMIEDSVLLELIEKLESDNEII